MPNSHYNKVILIGVVTTNLLLRFTKNAVPVTNFIIKTTDVLKGGGGSSNKKETELNKYHKIVCWGDLAKYASNDIKKGDIVLVEGELTYQKNKGESVAEIRITHFEVKNK